MRFDWAKSARNDGESRGLTKSMIVYHFEGRIAHWRRLGVWQGSHVVGIILFESQTSSALLAHNQNIEDASIGEDIHLFGHASTLPDSMGTFPPLVVSKICYIILTRRWRRFVAFNKWFFRLG